jgi:hypothetical protein
MPVNWDEVKKILEEKQRAQFGIPKTPSGVYQKITFPPAPPPRPLTFDPTYVLDCHLCHKGIKTSESYCQIAHFMIEKYEGEDSKYFSFHESCFESIAGKKYM